MIFSWRVPGLVLQSYRNVYNEGMAVLHDSVCMVMEGPGFNFRPTDPQLLMRVCGFLKSAMAYTGRYVKINYYSIPMSIVLFTIILPQATLNLSGEQRP
jgi:hypothetical protein